MTKPEYEAIESGVMLRIGTYDVATYPERTQREVHPDRRHESISYKIEQDMTGIRTDDSFGPRWNHYRYRFTYRFMGRTLSTTWHCGLSYGSPKPWDGLSSVFADAACVEWEAFGPKWECGYDYETEYHKAKRVYDACTRKATNLNRFFGDGAERDIWAGILGGK